MKTNETMMKRYKIVAAIVFLVSVAMLSSCTERSVIKDGDLIFVAEDGDNLSGAINRVTQTERKTNYSHVAIIKVEGDSIWVLEATTRHGSRRVLLADFVAEQGSEMDHYRLKGEYAASIGKAWGRAERMLGKPYNYSYLMNDSSYYCSDFIYRIFAADSIFELNPMTFVDPQTGEIDPQWVEYYGKLGIDVPQDEPGCNPNGLAASSKLEYLGRLRW